MRQLRKTWIETVDSLYLCRLSQTRWQWQRKYIFIAPNSGQKTGSCVLDTDPWPDPTRPGPKRWPGDPVTRDPDDPVSSLPAIPQQSRFMQGCAFWGLKNEILHFYSVFLTKKNKSWAIFNGRENVGFKTPALSKYALHIPQTKCAVFGSWMMNRQLIDPTNPNILIVFTLEVDLLLIWCLRSRNNLK